MNEVRHPIPESAATRSGPSRDAQPEIEAIRAELAQLRSEYEARQQACRTGTRHLPGSVAAAYHRAIEERRLALANPQSEPSPD